MSLDKGVRLRKLCDEIDRAAEDSQMVMALVESVRNIANEVIEEEETLIIAENHNGGVEVRFVRPPSARAMKGGKP